MKLFHVSEEADIEKFVPRIPTREDMDKSKGLVWSLTEPALPNWLTPRDCPRVTYRVKDDTTQEDIDKFFSSSSRYCVAIEYGWHVLPHEKRQTENTENYVVNKIPGVLIISNTLRAAINSISFISIFNFSIDR